MLMLGWSRPQATDFPLCLEGGSSRLVKYFLGTVYIDSGLQEIGWTNVEISFKQKYRFSRVSSYSGCTDIPSLQFSPKAGLQPFFRTCVPNSHGQTGSIRNFPKVPKKVGPKTSYTWGYNSAYTVAKTTELPSYKVIYSGPISPHLQLVGAYKSHLTGYMNSNALYKLHLALLWNRMWGGTLQTGFSNNEITPQELL